MSKPSKSGRSRQTDFAGDTIVRFDDVSFEYGQNKPILAEASFTVREGSKITLMGQNGAGKTTIFGLILGADEKGGGGNIGKPSDGRAGADGALKPESGEIYITNGATIATARQVIPRTDLELTVREFFAKCFKEKKYDLDPRIDEVLNVVNLKQHGKMHVSVPLLRNDYDRSHSVKAGEEDVPSASLSQSVENLDTSQKSHEGSVSPLREVVYSNEMETSENHASHNNLSKAPLKSLADIARKNSTHTDFKDRLMKTFSGGQQARLLLASALIQDPDILLLDEPTNNLDKSGIEHLTQFLIDYRKTCMVISHDADFLNAFTHGVLYLDIHTRKVEQYVGDYKDVVGQISARIEKENMDNARRAKEIEAKKYQAGVFAMKGGQMRLVAKRMREKAEELEEEMVDVRKEDKTIKQFHIPVQADTVGDIITISSYGMISPKTHKPVTRKCDIHLRRKTHLLISGPNGIGKSSLLEAIVKSQEAGVPASSITIADGIRVGYYRQDFSMMDFNDTVYQSLEKIIRSVEGRLIETELRAVAASFLIGADAIHTRIGSLSEGQKGLVAFARLVLLRPGLLILDEPTNHINFRHLPVIAKALDAYEGAMILVSHVPEFVRQIRIDETLEMGK